MVNLINKILRISRLLIYRTLSYKKKEISIFILISLFPILLYSYRLNKQIILEHQKPISSEPSVISQPVQKEEEPQKADSLSKATSKLLEQEKMFLWFFSGVFGYAAVYAIGKYISEK